MNFFEQGRAQLVALLGGTAFAWYSVAVDALRFYRTEGTLFKVSDCVYPNPITTPCFWGAVLFVIVLVFALRARKSADPLKRQRNILMMLLGGTLFAWANFSVSSWSFFLAPKGEGTSCSGVPADSPFVTACFYGALFFTASLVAGYVFFRALKRNTTVS
ncbi:MAG: hypothetical protein A2408_02105 [Candidatus Yonathbacteria bacterium RIFOXYC1_FULL_52_10]|uniref:Vitamin K epoxide reductase domain-containing protein n=1 Tax=Candidatus Yonathbacteria bacterium RIFOXYD1_FULL_52_36 TaxID=1802730 RepID=A0A1G2SLV6_9BACT|nr:MAG: hypothetical protein A2408_02105 [Candidatus Yonathbacteria bacterium RIFOXYC1_FULL_52_10]OHA86045.1 MAG: hypothetical protein A2591_01475 [Candidatus Yonathbacteria bacterium RIFOXYD1_FULL_52_36]